MVTSLARSVAVGDDQTMWQAIILVLLIAGAIRLTWKRPNTGGRLAVIGAGALLFWGAVALIDPGTAGKMAEWTALGFVTTIRGAASLIGDL